MKNYSGLKLVGAMFLAVALNGCGGGGGGAAGTAPKSDPGTGSGPTVVVVANASVKASGTTQFLAAVGSQVTLDGTASTDAGGTIASYAWALTSQPAGSAATLSSSSGGNVTLTPDLSGSYTVTLTITDSNGLKAAQAISLQVSSSIPVVNVVDNVVFSGPSSTVPTQTITIGSVVTMDASGSTDPANAPLSITWTILSQPVGSSATVVPSGNVNYFSPDVAGQYQIRARATNASGAYSDVIEVFVANNPPSAVVVVNATPVNGTGILTAYTGNQITLDSSGSTMPGTDTVVTAWAMLSKPGTSSTAQLSSTLAKVVHFVPDVVGTYVVQLSLQDTTNGTTALYTETITVNQAPVPVITGSSQPVLQVSGPTFVAQAHVPFTLNGSSSYNPTGSAMVYTWYLLGKPAGSTVQISNPAAQNLVFTPDVNGGYTFILTVTNDLGGSASQTVTVYAGCYPPVPIVAQSQISVLLGNTASDSAASSYDQDGNTLTYRWSIDAAPAGSVATIANPNSATLTFTPDVAGTYTATVTVTDGTVSSVATVSITAFAPQSGTMPLTYVPLFAKYDLALGKAIIVSANPNALHIVDPVAATDVSVALPAAVKSMTLSPNGLYAGVLHEGTVSLVDLSAAAIVASSGTAGSQTDVFLNNSEELYLTGQTGGQWASPGFTVLNGVTGATVQTTSYSIGMVYGTTLGVYSDVNSKFFIISLGLSPSQIYAINLDSNGNITTSSGSPYWGSYGMNAPLWLSTDQSLLYTGAGDYFKTADLTYQGSLGLSSGNSVLSLSNSASALETVLFQGSVSYNNITTYPAAYKRYTGSLQFVQADVALPFVASQQTYGRYIFHASDNSHIMVVQAGGSSSSASGLTYYLLKR